MLLLIRQRVDFPELRRAVGAILLAMVLGLTSTEQLWALEVTEQTSADVLAALLFPGTDGLVYTNGSATLQGHTSFVSTEFDPDLNEQVDVTLPSFSSGTFTNVSGTYGIGNGLAAGPEGVVLSTEDVRNFGDLNDTFVGTSTFAVPATAEQEGLLAPITGQENHNDVTQLTIPFDNTTGSDQTLDLFTVFGTQEYPEFVGTEFNDGFGAYLNGVNIATFRDLPMNIDHPNVAPFFGTRLTGLISDLQDNRFDPRLALSATAQPGANELTLIIGDASDDDVGSTVYLSRDIITGPVSNQPRLPDAIGDEGEFIFIFPDVVTDDEMVFIDPDVAVGYLYEVIGSATTPDPRFDSVVIPPVGGDSFFISFGSVVNAPILGNQVFDFTIDEPDGVSSFTITGINTDAMIDPNDTLAFLTGVSFTTDVQGISVTQTPITVFVPEPTMLTVFMLGGMALLRRRSC